MDFVHTDKAPQAIGPYSQALKVNGLVYTSGQIPIDPATGNIEATTEQAIKNLNEVLLAAGTNLDRVIKTTCFLKNIGDFAAFNEVYAKFFKYKPARSCVEVSALPKGALVEIEVIAQI